MHPTGDEPAFLNYCTSGGFAGRWTVGPDLNEPCDSLCAIGPKGDYKQETILLDDWRVPSSPNGEAEIICTDGPPSFEPTLYPSLDPTADPSFDPTLDPSNFPSFHPTSEPTNAPSVTTCFKCFAS